MNQSYFFLLHGVEYDYEGEADPASRVEGRGDFSNIS